MATELNQNELEKVVGGNDLGSTAVTPETILMRAKQELRKDYKWGGAGPEAYDAAGLVSYCVCGYHTHIGTTYTFLTWPKVTDPQPGDICVSTNNCGIYVGGGSMIHATEGVGVHCGPVEGGMIYVRYE